MTIPSALDDLGAPRPFFVAAPEVATIAVPTPTAVTIAARSQRAAFIARGPAGVSNRDAQRHDASCYDIPKRPAPDISNASP